MQVFIVWISVVAASSPVVQSDVQLVDKQTTPLPIGPETHCNRRHVNVIESALEPDIFSSVGQGVNEIESVSETPHGIVTKYSVFEILHIIWSEFEHDQTHPLGARSLRVCINHAFKHVLYLSFLIFIVWIDNKLYFFAERGTFSRKHTHTFACSAFVQRSILRCKKGHDLFVNDFGRFSPLWNAALSSEKVQHVPHAMQFDEFPAIMQCLSV